MSKTPFEVRLEVLKMAKEMMERQYDDASALAWSIVEKQAEFQNKAMADMQDYYESLKPTMYTPEEILEKAQELYTFVTKKD